MSKYKCTTCAGEYSDVLTDGLEYYHACPPELVAEDEYKERADKRDENVGKNLAGKGRSKIQ